MRTLQYRFGVWITGILLVFSVGSLGVSPASADIGDAGDPSGGSNSALIISQTELSLVERDGSFFVQTVTGDQIQVTDTDTVLYFDGPTLSVREVKGALCDTVERRCNGGLLRRSGGNYSGCSLDSSGNCQGECRYCTGGMRKGRICRTSSSASDVCLAAWTLPRLGCGTKNYYPCVTWTGGHPLAPPNGCGCNTNAPPRTTGEKCSLVTCV